MEKIPVHNNTAMAIYVAGRMIPSGETMHFDLDQVPPHLRPAPASPEDEAPELDADPLATILGHSVKDITAMLPSLSVDELAALGEAEQMAAKPRTSLLGAIAEETLKRSAG